MSVEQKAIMKQRRTISGDVPDSLEDGQLAYVQDTGDLLVGTPNQDNVANRNSYPYKNTRILTEWSNSVENLLNYRFRWRGSDAGNQSGFAHATSITGKPITRKLQEVLDEHVSVQAYGAMGDGITDDYYAIRRASIDVMTARSPNYGKALYFPSGRYYVSKTIFLPPQSRWIGDGKFNTIIYTTNNIDAVIETCDSGMTINDIADPTRYGTHIRQNIGSNPSYKYPNNITISGISFSHEGPPNATMRVVALLIRCSDVNFHDCGFSATYICGSKIDNSPYISSADTVCIIIDALALPNAIANIKFDNCLYKNSSYGIVLTDNLKNVVIRESYIENMYRFLSVGEPVAGTPTLTRSYPIAGIKVDDMGSGYTSAPSVVITSGSGINAVALASVGCRAYSPLLTGSGYAVGDVISISGGTLSSYSGAVPMSAKVTQVDGLFRITGVSIVDPGNYSAPPVNPVTITGGSGTGATATLVYGVSNVVIINSGSGYVSTDTITISGGGGAGASASINYLDGPRGIHIEDCYLNKIQHSAISASAGYAIPTNIVSMLNYYDNVGFGSADCSTMTTRAYTVINYGNGVKNCAVVLDAFTRQGPAKTVASPISAPRIQYSFDDDHFILSLQDGTHSSGPATAIQYQTKTSDYTITLDDNPSNFDNIGAAGPVNFTLPPAIRGLEFTFCVVEGFDVTIFASGSDTITLGNTVSSLGGGVISGFSYSTITMRALSATQWVAISSTGNWAII